MSIETGHDAERCPRCGALVRPGSPWCTLCYADLRAAPAPAPAPDQPPQPARGPASESASGVSVDPLTAPLALLERQPEQARRGRHAAPDPDEQVESLESAESVRPAAGEAVSAATWLQ